MSGPLSIRAAHERDLDRLIEIHSSAFPDPRGFEARARLFRDNPLGDLDRLHVAERAGHLLAHAFLFPLAGWFGGRAVKFGAIASVGVAPEARGQGVAHALLDGLHRIAVERGDAFTLLYPFRQAFYGHLGYVAVSSSRLLTLHPCAIPESWGSRPQTATDVVRPATGDDGQGIFAAYDEDARAHTGWIVRPTRLWERRLIEERRRWFVLERKGRIAGYVSWTLKQSEPHAATQLEIGELVASDDEARRRLLGFVGAQRDQVAEVTLEVADDDPIHRALVDADSTRYGTERVEHATGVIVGGPMLRLTDDARAVEARGYREDGAIDLAVEGEPAKRIQIRHGAATIGPSEGGPVVRVERRALAAILYGGLAASHAARLGWLTVDSPFALRLADALFAHPSFFALDTF